MTNSRSAAFLVALALLRPSYGNAGAQQVDVSETSVKQQVLSLDSTGNGQTVAATVGQQMEITLPTTGGGHYGDPQVSSSAIRFENVALAWPPTPGGPTQFTFSRRPAKERRRSRYPIQNQSPPLR